MWKPRRAGGDGASIYIQWKARAFKHTDKNVTLIKGIRESLPQEMPDVECKRVAAQQIPGRLPGVETAVAEKLKVRRK